MQRPAGSTGTLVFSTQSTDLVNNRECATAARQRDVRVTRILLRASKSPFEVASATTTIERNLVASNSGNLLFIDAAWKALSAPGVEITADRLAVGPGDADHINERYDAYVVTLANAFRISFDDNLDRLTRLIRRLRIPVVVLGVGAQGTVDYDFAGLRRIDRRVKAFAAAVLDRSPTIGVRGEATQAYMARLGFRDVEVIGCPSMFLWGDRLRVERKVPTLDERSRVAITISPYRQPMGRIVMASLARYPRLAYVAQDLDTLCLMVDGLPLPGGRPSSRLPLHPAHRLFREGRTRLYLDPWTWIDDLRGFDYLFGTRIHGAIAALLAGTPATLLAHDSRTLELARYFDIPHRLLRDVPADVDAADLHREVDLGPLHAGHPARFAAYTRFLERAGLDHVFAHDGAVADFERRVATTPFPPAVTSSTPAPAVPGPASAVRRARSRARRLAVSPTGRRLRSRLRVIRVR